jgi:Cu/Ag efflux protein CusF
MRIASSLLALMFGLSVAGSALAADATMAGTNGAAATSQSQPAKGDVKKVSKKSKKGKKKGKARKTAAETTAPAAQ